MVLGPKLGGVKVHLGVRTDVGWVGLHFLFFSIGFAAAPTPGRVRVKPDVAPSPQLEVQVQLEVGAGASRPGFPPIPGPFFSTQKRSQKPTAQTFPWFAAVSSVGFKTGGSVVPLEQHSAIWVIKPTKRSNHIPTWRPNPV